MGEMISYGIIGGGEPGSAKGGFFGGDITSRQHRFPTRPFIAADELAALSPSDFLTKQDLTDRNVPRRLPRISVASGGLKETTERRYLDTTDSTRWRSAVVLTRNSVGQDVRYDVLEKVTDGTDGRLVLCINEPVVAYMEGLPPGKLAGTHIALLNPGVTQETVATDNIKRSRSGMPAISDTNDTFMVTNILRRIESFGAEACLWEQPRQREGREDFRRFLQRNDIQGIIVNGGSVPEATIWMVDHLETISNFLSGNPNSWCALLCAPVYSLNPGPLRPVYEAEDYRIPDDAIEHGIGFVGEDAAVQIHSDTRNQRLRALQPLFDARDLVLHIPEKGVFIY